MGQLVYSMITSLDGYAEAAEGCLGLGAEDEEVHTFIDETFRSVGTYLYGRRMYETMVFWETAHAEPDAPPCIVDFARGWQAAEKVVFSTTLASVSSARTRIERTFDPEAVRRLKAESDHDLSVDGPNLAAQAIAAGLVDEYHLFVTTTVVGGGKRFFPAGLTPRPRPGRPELSRPRPEPVEGPPRAKVCNGTRMFIEHTFENCQGALVR